jgi:multiple sugar transport system permease protein
VTRQDSRTGPTSGRESAPARRTGRRYPTLAKQESRAGLTLLSPTLVIVLVVVVLPILWTVMLAFQRIRLITIRRAGLFQRYTLDNFERVFNSPGFWDSLLVTLIYAVFGTALSVVLGLVAAMALRAPFRGRTLVRASTLLPYIAPVVAMTFVWKTMLNPQYGIANEWGTRFLGWDRAIDFLNESDGTISLFGLHLTVPTALLTVIAFETWRYFPFAFLFILARIQALPSDLEEAARVDGATPTQGFRWVVLPQLMPVIALLCVLRFIFTFNKFDDVLLLTGGGSGTEVVSVRVYKFLTSRGDVGAAAAQALVLAAVLVVFVAIYLKFFGSRMEADS